ncbi:MAG: bL28 family ribosomal protein [Candidatus Parcubacteria bacterium]|nr:bL28 family ribosomal protein [Candidatus Parcubacteria bacterium]
MSRTCEICGRGPLSSASRSHSNIKTLTKKYLNLQTKKINGKKTKICTSCMRNQNKAAKA